MNSNGAIVQVPSTGTTTTTVQQPSATIQQSGEEGTATVEQVQRNLQRYELHEKKGKREVYYDRQTVQKAVKRERD